MARGEDDERMSLDSKIYTVRQNASMWRSVMGVERKAVSAACQRKRSGAYVSVCGVNSTHCTVREHLAGITKCT